MNLKGVAGMVGDVVESKNRLYGNSTSKTGDILRILYGNEIPAHQYSDMLLVTRVLDKLSRISQRAENGIDGGGESPWMDIAGYGVIGLHKDLLAQPVPTCGCSASDTGIVICARHRDEWAQELDQDQADNGLAELGKRG